MFILEQTNIANAIKAARKLHPKVKMVRFGEYLVSGSKGNYYTVHCQRQPVGRIVDCTCPTQDFTACKHGMAAVSLHIAVARQRQATAH